MKKIETPSLKKELGLLGSFAMGFADVGADIFLALGLIAAYAHGLMPLAILVVAIVYICSGLAYAELGAAIPVSGGSSAFAKETFGNFAGFLAGWGLILDYTLCIALFAFASAGYLSFFFPAIASLIPSIAALLIFVLMAVNLLGIKESSSVNSALTVIVIVIVTALIFLGFSFSFDYEKFKSGLTPIAKDPGFRDFLYSITIAMVTFVGIESISQGAEETKDPGKTIPRATLLSIFFVVVFAIFMSVMALGLVTPATLAENMEKPLIPVADALPFANVLVPIVAFAGFMICFVSANTGVIGVSRVVYFMGKSGLVSRRLSWVHPKFRTPWITTIIFSIIAMLLAYFSDMVLLGELYAFGALTAYTLTNLSSMQLRIKMPDLIRPFKMPFNVKIGEHEISLVSLVGIFSCLTIFILVAFLHVEGRNFAFLWFLIGIIYFKFYQDYRNKEQKMIAHNKAQFI
ncbi:amino acid permease [Candidatus Micrarchaeota archaeon]|nr:amino acid permease [Candidatus Micrarchaeota archaeon]